MFSAKTESCFTDMRYLPEIPSAERRARGGEGNIIAHYILKHESAEMSRGSGKMKEKEARAESSGEVLRSARAVLYSGVLRADACG